MKINTKYVLIDKCITCLIFLFSGLNYELATDYKCAVFTAEANNKNNYYANACKIIEHKSIPLRLPACELAPVNGTLQIKPN